MANSKQTSGKKKTTSAPKGKQTGKQTGKRGGAAKAAPRSKPDYRSRLYGGFACFILAVFSAFGYFDTHGVLLDWLVGLLRGLVGFGFWITPMMLLYASIVLFFHRGMPVRLRTAAALLTPAVFSALAQSIIGTEPGDLNAAYVRTLWSQGQELRSGGVLGGVTARGLILLLSRQGAVFIMVMLALAFLMVLLQKTPTDLLRWINDVREERQRLRAEENWQEPEDWQEEAQEPEEPAAYPASRRSAQERRREPSRRRGGSIDVPVDAQVEPAPEPSKAQEKPKRIPLKKKRTLLPAGEEQTPPAPPVLEEERPAAQEQTVQELVPETGAELNEAVAPADFPEQSFFQNLVRQHRAQEQLPQSQEPAPPPPVPMELPELEDPRKSRERSRREQEQVSAQVAKELDRQMSRKAEYVHPPLELLSEGKGGKEDARKEIAEVTDRLDDTFEAFGIDAHVIGEIRGPTVTQYELAMGRGVKLSRVTGMADDITVSLGVEKVRIAPIPGKSQVVGVEIPNRKATPVPIRDVLSSNTFQRHKSDVAFALGKDIAGSVVVGNIAKLPHMLIAGTTGSGKSVCTNSIVISLLYRSSPEQVRLIMIDPKIVEFEGYNGIPHLLIPVVTDPKKAAGALQWAVTEMLKRYRSFAERHVRDLDNYNKQVRGDKDTDEEPMPRIVVIIDELADLMLVASKEVEESICRLAQMGRAAGMHLIIATQRPSSDVITGLMKANIPSRIALTVSSGMESRIILDTQGAEKLLGNGDMLYNPVGAKRPTRVQGCFISDQEVADVIEYIKSNSESNYDDGIMQEVEQNAENAGKNGKKGGSTLPTLPDSTFDDSAPASPSPEEGDPMMNAAIDIVVETGMASVSSLQRKLKLGYSRAARLVDQMEELGVVGPFEGSKPRKVLITKEQWNEMKMRGGALTDLDHAKAMSEAADREEMHMEDVEMPPFEVD